MTETTVKPDPKMEPVETAKEAGYDAWFREGVKKARKEAPTRPEDMIPLAEARRELGL